MPNPRWWPNADGVLVPLINRIHVIPVEDGSLMHCAQMSCWCCPSFKDGTELMAIHQNLTLASAEWVNIGEVDDLISPPDDDS